MADFKHMVVLLPGISGSVLEKDGKALRGATIGTVLKTLFRGGKHLDQLRLPAGDDGSANVHRRG